MIHNNLFIVSFNIAKIQHPISHLQIAAGYERLERIVGCKDYRYGNVYTCYILRIYKV